jgi:hypothetical protein
MASRRIGSSPPRLFVAVALIAAVLVPAAAAHAAVKAPPRPPPQPQKLWNAYPLGSGGPQSPSRSSGRTKPPAGASHRSNGSGQGPSRLLLWIALGCFGASLVAFAVAWRETAPVRRVRRGLITGGELLAAFGADLVSRLQRLRIASAERLALAAHGPDVTWREVRGLRLAGARLARTSNQVLSKPPQPPAESDEFSPDDYDAAREQAVLKRKLAGAPSEEVRRLRAKNGGVTNGRDKQWETGVLRAKLADPREATCRIVWWRDSVKSQFHATGHTPEGQERLVLNSPSFRWTESTPPPQELPEIARAHEVLLAELEATGWSAFRTGDHWYEREFQRRSTPAARLAQKGER